MEQRKIVKEDWEVNYNICGSGKPIMLIHGFGLDSTCFSSLAENLERDHLLIMPDLPGFGRSPATRDTVSIALLSEICLEVLATENISHAHIAGHSMGGYIALEMLEKMPDLFSSLTLIHSHAYADQEKKKKERRKGIDFIHKYGSKRYAKETIPYLFDEEFRRDNENYVQLVKEKAGNISELVLIDYLEAMIKRPDKATVLQECEKPVLFILGEEDQTALLEPSLEQAAWPQNSMIRIFFGKGHFAFMEEPEETLQTLQDFFTFTEEIK